jgi:predicted permease
MLWSVLTPANASLIAGVVWAAIGFKLPFFLHHFTEIHRIAFMAPGFVVVGIYMFYYREYRPLIDAPFQSVMMIAMKLFVVPALAFGWTRAFGIEADITRAIVLLHAMPLGFPAMEAAARLEAGVQNFLATTILAIGVLIAWVAALNQLN